ncbi:MAG: hypothetical protein KC776_21485 [Myxococcales bacterium]|nr:hypothetical protein [Myxococcales bacterium]MCB9576341.1 hypothetical protein [Polyangiaceae bacterium]
MSSKPLTWLIAGAGTGLVIALSTRWYWGAVAFLLLSAVIGGVHLLGGGLRPTLRRHGH